CRSARRATLSVSLELDDLLYAARAVRVAHGERQQPREELDPLRVRVRSPRGRIRALPRAEVHAGSLESRPERRPADVDVPRAAIAVGERTPDLFAHERPQVLVQVHVPALALPARGP